MTLWKISLPLVAALVAFAAIPSEAVAAEAPFSRLVVPAATFGCTFSDGQLLCGTINGKKHKHVDNQDDGQMQGQSPCPQGGGAAGFAKSKNKPCMQSGNPTSDTGSQGERSCPPGYVVLDKPNKYHSFCEPKEGFPDQVDEASCAQKGLKYIPGGGNKCYCPGQKVNKGTGLLAATQGDQCVSVAEYNAAKGQCPSGMRLSTEGCVPLRTCCNFQMNGKTYGKCEVDRAQAQSEARALADANGHPEAPVTCGQPEF